MINTDFSITVQVMHRGHNHLMKNRVYLIPVASPTAPTSGAGLRAGYSREYSRVGVLRTLAPHPCNYC